MRLCIVPMKPLALAKARLAGVLSAEERRQLSLAMLRDVVRAAAALDAVWVLNSDEDAALVARELGAEPRPDPAPGGGLNASLAAATATAAAAGAQGVLVLSADCPAATPDDVLSLALGPGVTLTPDRSGKGTNALWREPPEAIEVAFGPGSRNAHLAQAQANGIPVAVIANERIGLDVDRPADLDDLWDRAWGDATRAAMASLGYPQRRGRR